MELHDKINKVVQMYDHLLEQRMSGYRSGAAPSSYPYYGTTDPATAIPNNSSNPPQYAPDYQAQYQHTSGAPPSSSTVYGSAPGYPPLAHQQQLPQQQAMYPPGSNGMNHQQMYPPQSAPPQQQQPVASTPPVTDERPLIDL